MNRENVEGWAATRLQSRTELHAGFAAALFGFTALAGFAGDAGSLDPDTARAGFQVDPGLQVELVAAEPLVADPVALTFDERGRLFVAESRDYPVGPARGAGPGARIAMLEDTDGDGRMDRRSEFVTGLTFPNGVMPWRGGLIVTCAPDVFYFADTDGDGVADVRRVLLTGFSTGGSTQLRVSHPTLGADGWVYLTSGFTHPGRVRSPLHPDREPLELQTDSRFDPSTLELVREDGRAQFGMSFDDFGRRFICFNRVHIQHVVLPSRYLKRNPLLAFSRSVHDVPEGRTRDWIPAAEGLASRTYPISENITTYDSHAGTFSAACAVHVFGGNGLGAEYRGDVFSCDPTGNLVHRDRLTASGPTFTARMVNEGREFLAARDNWFRPVALGEGPDGALYVADMYRKTIEHPEYLPEETRKNADFESGRGMGRIWRVRSGVVDPGLARANRIDWLKQDASGLVRLLSHPNAWHRRTAHRLLVEQGVEAGRAGLIAALRGRGSTPGGRFLAMNLAARGGFLDDELLLRLLRDGHAGVRAEAVRLAEGRVAGSSPVAGAVYGLAEDSDGRVRFACALAAGGVPGEAALAVLARIAARDGADEWARAGVLSGLRGRSGAFLEVVVKGRGGLDPEFAVELGRLVGQEIPLAQVRATLSRVGDAGDGFGAASRIGLIEGLTAGAIKREGTVAVDDLRKHRAAASVVLADVGASMAGRRAAAGLLARLGEEGLPDLLERLDPREPAELQYAVVRALMGAADGAGMAALFENGRWNRLAPGARSLAVGQMVGQTAGIRRLLDAIESGVVSASVLSSRQRTVLRDHGDAAVRDRSRKLFEAGGTTDRMKAYEAAKAALALKGNPGAGRALFGTHCAGCHRLDRQGVIVGPELVAMRRQDKEVLLLHIVHPNYEVAPPFAAYEVETRDGRTLTGLLASETATSVTLRQAQGIEETVLRGDLKRLEASRVSLMPEELEKAMTLQELADLVAHVKGEVEGEGGR